MRKLRVFFNTRVPENEIISKSARQIKPLQVASRLEMKVGFWMRYFHVLETHMQVMMDFTGNRRKTSVMISGGRESHIDLETSSEDKLSDIA